MTERSLRNRMQKAEEAAKSRSMFSADCICFPEEEQPFFGFPDEGDAAFLVKCPLHGDRFQWPVFFIYVPEWRRKSEPARRERLSAQYRKAWDASFPADLGPAVSTPDGKQDSSHGND